MNSHKAHKEKRVSSHIFLVISKIFKKQRKHNFVVSTNDVCWIWCINQFMMHKTVTSDWSFSGIDNLHLTGGALTMVRLAVSDSATNAHLLASRRSRIPIYNGRIDSYRGTSNSVNEMCCFWLSSHYLTDKQIGSSTILYQYFFYTILLNKFIWTWLDYNILSGHGKKRKKKGSRKWPLP